LITVNIDRDDNALLHEQVAAEIRRAIAEGEAGPGERLPPARHLAAVMGVNTNTVLRALRILRDEGLLEMRPRRGIHVVGTPTESAVRNRVAELIAFARAQGYTRAQIVQMVSESAAPTPR
jgi:GntR family transcriptional regulator